MSKRTLSLYLLKPDVHRPEDALAGRAPRSYGVRELAKAKLFLRQTSREEPEWLAFLRPHLSPLPSRRSTRSLSGLLVFAAEERWFALAFGYGRMLLDPEAVVSDFGLRVALNTVDPDELRSIDTKTLEEVTALTRRQLSRGASITSFELDLNRDLVKTVRGRSKDVDFADQVAGSEALRITGAIDFEQIAPRVREAFKRYSSQSYKSRFGWIDHVRLLTDPAKQRTLDIELENVLAGTLPGSVSLAAPSILDEEDFGGFRYLRAENPIVFELSWPDYVALKQAVPSLTVLRRDRIAVVSAASGEASRQWSVYAALIVEFEIGGTRYVLSGGDWYEVDQAYARETRTAVEGFETKPLQLPAARSRESEGRYNQRACRELGDRALLLDRRLFAATQSQDRIEFCDIVLKPNRFIHVKRKSGSATLSHLFNQGIVSGELLHFDEGFRNAVRAAFSQRAGFGRMIRRGALDPSSWEVAFAVIAPPAHHNRHFLPFFSQVSFRRAAEQLSGRGYRVSLTRVDVVP